MQTSNGARDTPIHPRNLYLTDEDIGKILRWSKPDQLEPVPYPAFHHEEPSSNSIMNPDALCAIDFISRQASVFPHRQAVFAHDGSLTYAELEQYATMLALHLFNIVGGFSHVGKFIPFCIEKSKWAIVAVLGILKAGAAYVSLDPGHPQRRLEEIVRQIRPRVILSSPQNEARAATLGTHLVVSPELFDRNVLPMTLPLVSRSDSAYVIFSSGTTGKPKGIVIGHGALVVSMSYLGRLFKITSETRMLQFASLGFDASVLEIFATLMFGGTICVLSDEDRLNDCAGFINKSRVDTFTLTPSFMRLLDLRNIPGVRTFISSGECLRQSDVDSLSGKLRFVNAYGPTECSVMCTATDVETSTLPENIGKPLSGRVWIVDVDDHNKLVPVGQVGEICIEGAVLAQGYLNDLGEPVDGPPFIRSPSWATELKASVSWPFSRSLDDSEMRIYKSGDLAKFDDNGNLIYMGRKDGQIKLRGLRVNLGEIEQCVCSASDSVTDCVVQLVTLQGSIETIVAFYKAGLSATDLGREGFCYSPSEESMALTHAIETSMMEYLPSYMLPSLFIPLHHIPLTVGGKIDKSRLRKFASSLNIDTFAQYRSGRGRLVTPTSFVELQLARLWAKVLRIKQNEISANDLFWDLRGDSASAIELVTLARKEGLYLSVADVFKHPRLGDLASTLDSKNETITQAVSEEKSNTSHSGDAVWFTDLGVEAQMEAICEATDYQTWSTITSFLEIRGNVNYFTIDFSGKIDQERLESACAALVRHHPILRTVFAPRGTKLHQFVLADCKTTLHVFDVEELETATSNIIAFDRARPIRFGQPVIRFMALNRAGDCQRLLVRLSHAIYDGMCLPIFWKDLKASYEREPLSQASPFHHFIRSFSAIEMTAAKEFWRDFLRGSRMSAIVERKQPTYTNSWNSVHERSIPNLPSVGGGYTVSTVLLAAWSTTLALLTGSSDVVYGYLVAGRTSSHRTDAAGPCVNILAMRTRLLFDQSVLDLFAQTKSAQVSSMPHDFLGWQQTVEECTDWPMWTRFSSVVHYQNLASDPAIESIGGAQCKIGSIGQATDRCDVWVEAFPQGSGLTVQVLSNESMIPEDISRGMLDSMCSLVEAMVKNPKANLDTIDMVKAANSPVLPLQSNSISIPSPPAPSVSTDKQRANSVIIKRLIDQAWGGVFETEITENPQVPWFELRGSLLAAVILSERLKEAGLLITLEQVIAYPTREAQLKLVLSATEFK